MFNISSIYPRLEGSQFDIDYYLNTHMPMSIEALADTAGFLGVKVEQGVDIENPKIDSTYYAMCHYYFDTLENFMQAFAPHAEKLQGDIKNYTDVEPIIQVNKVAIAR